MRTPHPRPWTRAIAGPLFLLTAAAGWAGGWGEEHGIHPGVAPTIERMAAAERDRLGIPGLSLAVDGAHGSLALALGQADVGRGVPTRPTTVFRLASVSKPVTAVAAMQLAESGALDLDAPVRRYVPDYPAQPWPVTCRQLLAHLGGVRGYRGAESANTQHFRCVAESVDRFRDEPLACRPGTRYLYSSYGYNLVGAAIEEATGLPFVAALRARVFTPAGMTAAGDDATAGPGERAHGYQICDGALRDAAPLDTSDRIPGGGLCATASDVAAFGRALLENRLVLPRTRDQMFTEQRTACGNPTGYGLGWRVGHRDGRREVYHQGGQSGASTILYLLPEQDVAVAILGNLEGADLLPLARSIADLTAAGR